jgi:hypothetical protein
MLRLFLVCLVLLSVKAVHDFYSEKNFICELCNQVVYYAKS